MDALLNQLREALNFRVLLRIRKKKVPVKSVPSQKTSSSSIIEENRCLEILEPWEPSSSNTSIRTLEKCPFSDFQSEQSADSSTCAEDIEPRFCILSAESESCEVKPSSTDKPSAVDNWIFDESSSISSCSQSTCSSNQSEYSKSSTIVDAYDPNYETYVFFKTPSDTSVKEQSSVSSNSTQSPSDFGEKHLNEFLPLDPEGAFIQSVCIQCGRILAGYPFGSALTEKNCIDMETEVKAALQNITDDDLKGTYHSFEEMSKEMQAQMIKDHFLLKNGECHSQFADTCNFWPKGRGLFYNKDKTFMVWINVGDHLRIISMDQGSNFGRTLDRLLRGVKAIEQKISFVRDERLGWLTSCPTNLGSAVRVSVYIKLPKLSAKSEFKKILEDLSLKVRDGEGSNRETSVFEVSNKEHLSLSDYQTIKQMYESVKKLIELEKAAV